VEFIGYAQEKSTASGVKFLTFREALERIEKNALLKSSLRDLGTPRRPQECAARWWMAMDSWMSITLHNEGIRNGTGFFSTPDHIEIWHPKENRWHETTNALATI